MCDLDFDGSPGFHEKTHPRARLVHHCVVCRDVIHAGQRYLREAYKWEGDVGSDVCCMRCEKARDKFGAAHAGYPFPSSFIDFLSSCIHDGDDESDRLWRPMLRRIEARRKAADMIEKRPTT